VIIKIIDNYIEQEKPAGACRTLKFHLPVVAATVAIIAATIAIITAHLAQRACSKVALRASEGINRVSIAIPPAR